MKYLDIEIGNDDMHCKLKETIGKKRYNHSIGVAKTAIKLAKQYGCCKEKAALAGLLHDCGKFQDLDQILRKAKEFDMVQDSVMKENIALLHGPLGSIIAKEEYYIQDKEILEAINIHTTGKPKMNSLEKIIYLADYIEPGRVFQGVEYIRKISYIDMDKALLLALGNTIKFVLDKELLLHQNTIDARNYLILKLNGNRRELSDRN